MRRLADPEFKDEDYQTNQEDNFDTLAHPMG
jgi:hypothetical protein